MRRNTWISENTSMEDEVMRKAVGVVHSWLSVHNSSRDSTI
uniref:Uncharacterized protein n=1 Tax=Nelumbo nucifera TaxID=4432 RepID=A0A822XWR4_NELNU|nr:TPA_asm: hypothetical protein HUJ06_027552 [Nelumbo nucifera]